MADTKREFVKISESYTQELKSMMQTAQDNLELAEEALAKAEQELNAANEELRRTIKSSSKGRFFLDAIKLFFYSFTSKKTLQFPKALRDKLNAFIKMREAIPELQEVATKKRATYNEAKKAFSLAINCVKAVDTLMNDGEVPKSNQENKKKNKKKS